MVRLFWYALLAASASRNMSLIGARFSVSVTRRLVTKLGVELAMFAPVACIFATLIKSA